MHGNGTAGAFACKRVQERITIPRHEEVAFAPRGR
jgi:hypothetical protein